MFPGTKEYLAIKTEDVFLRRQMNTSVQVQIVVRFQTEDQLNADRVDDSSAQLLPAEGLEYHPFQRRYTVELLRRSDSASLTGEKLFHIRLSTSRFGYIRCGVGCAITSTRMA